MSKRMAKRVFLYVLGLYAVAFSIGLSIQVDLGISPINALPYVFQQSFGLNMTVWVTVVYGIYLLLQAILLRWKLPLSSLFQIPASLVFGFFVDLTTFLLAWLVVSQYGLRLLLLFLSFLIVGVGLTIYVKAQLLNLPVEGLTLVLSERMNRSFGQAKLWIDYTSLVLSVLFALLLLGNLTGVREGTVLYAIFVGPLLIRVGAWLNPKLDRFLGQEDAPAVGVETEECESADV